jgi:hypothetical protein
MKKTTSLLLLVLFPLTGIAIRLVVIWFTGSEFIDLPTLYPFDLKLFFGSLQSKIYLALFIAWFGMFSLDPSAKIVDRLIFSKRAEKSLIAGQE